MARPTSDPRTWSDPTPMLKWASVGTIVTIVLLILAPPLGFIAAIPTPTWLVTGLYRHSKIWRFLKARGVSHEA